MSTIDYRIVAGQALPALTVSLPFDCEINLDKIFNTSSTSHSIIKVFTSQNGFLYCEQLTMNQLNIHWANLIEIARNCSEQNVTLNRLNGSNQMQLCTSRPIRLNECLRMWPSPSLLAEWNIPDYLQLANFIGINQYKCINCSKVYEEPNQLKIHCALSCAGARLIESKNTSIDQCLTSDQLIAQQSLIKSKSTTTCNDLFNQFQNSSNHHQIFKNSSSQTQIGLNPFNFTLSSLGCKSDSILKTNLNSNLDSNLSHTLVSNTPTLTYTNNHSINNLIGHNNLMNGLTSLVANAGLPGCNGGALTNSSLISNNSMNNNLINNNYLNNHLMVKRKKTNDNDDLLSALNKLNESQRADRSSLNLSACMDRLNKNPLITNQQQLSQLNGLGRFKKLNGSNYKTNNINLIDSDQSSSDVTDDMLNNDQVVTTSSSIGLINHINPVSKSRAMKLTKEPRTHTCKFCGKLYTRKYGLKIHIRTHTGHKPLKCIHCSRRFSDPSNLNKHQRLHPEHRQWKHIDVKS